MKIRLIWVAGLLLALSGCRKEPLTPSVGMDAYTDCKPFLFKSATDTPKDQDCIEFSYDDQKLVIRHVNAAFNCCPEQLYVDLKVNGDTLVITEREKSALCDCDCLYDLDYTLSDIARGTWWIRVVEPYAKAPDDDEIFFEVNLRKEPEGVRCYQRTRYPWKL